MEYVWWILMVAAAGAMVYFSSTEIVKFQRNAEWQSYVVQHYCKQSQIDPKIWSCIEPSPTWLKKEE